MVWPTLGSRTVKEQIKNSVTPDCFGGRPNIMLVGKS